MIFWGVKNYIFISNGGWRASNMAAMQFSQMVTISQNSKFDFKYQMECVALPMYWAKFKVIHEMININSELYSSIVGLIKEKSGRYLTQS